jgi:hypothetical protein
MNQATLTRLSPMTPASLHALYEDNAPSGKGSPAHLRFEAGKKVGGGIMRWREGVREKND